MKLQSKIISTVIMIFILINMIFLLIFFKREESYEIKRLNEKIEKTSELLNQVNSGPLYDYDIKKLETNLRSFLKDSEIYSLSLKEINGDLNLFYGEKEIILKDELIGKKTDLFFQDEKIGEIYGLYTKKIINDRLENSLRQLLGFQFIITLVISFVLYILLRKIIHPISELTRLSTEIVEGNLETEININRNDELGILADSFMRMKASINQKIDDLQIENVKRREAILRSYRQQEAIFQIGSKEHFNEDWNQIAKLITEYSSTAMDVGRVSIWIYSEDKSMIDCSDLYSKKEQQHMTEESLYRTEYPVYFSALKEEKVISVVDVLTDRRTAELSEIYLNPYSIRSLIDAPIRVAGKVFGVICFESLHIQKNWTKDEEIFAERIAEQISTFLTEAERKKQERELRQLRNYLVNIIDSMPSEIITVDSRCIVTLWNKKAEMSTGISAERAIGRSITEVFPQLNLDGKRILSSIKTGKIIYDKKREKLTAGGIFYEDLTIYPLAGHGDEGAVIRIDDTSDIIRMEEMMIQSEKMLSVGGLAAGMAHEINNPLAGMMQTASVMANRLGDKADLPANVMAAENSGITVDSIRRYMSDRDIPRMLNTIREAGQRIAEIVENMLSFSRKSDGLTILYSINTLLDKTLELAGTDYDLKKQYDFKSIEICREYDNEIPSLHCEGAKIQQVILNILRNGAQAMLEVHEPKPRFIIRTKYVKERSIISFEIEDNGPGMTNEVRKRIFEPFFTTKPVGVGTGLGLSVSYFIITENHNGNMSVKSRPGNGCTFIIELPLGQKV